MNDPNLKNIGREFHKTVDELRALHQEAKLKLHLASADARDAWTRIEPAIADAEREASNVTVEGLRRIEGSLKKLRELLASL